MILVPSKSLQCRLRLQVPLENQKKRVPEMNLLDSNPLTRAVIHLKNVYATRRLSKRSLSLFFGQRKMVDLWTLYAVAGTAHCLLSFICLFDCLTACLYIFFCFCLFFFLSFPSSLSPSFLPSPINPVLPSFLPFFYLFSFLLSSFPSSFPPPFSLPYFILSFLPSSSPVFVPCLSSNISPAPRSMN